MAIFLSYAAIKSPLWTWSCLSQNFLSLFLVVETRRCCSKRSRKESPEESDSSSSSGLTLLLLPLFVGVSFFIFFQNQSVLTNSDTMFCGEERNLKTPPPFPAQKMRAHHRRDLFLFYDHESASKSEIPKMILSNDQKHTFTTFGARAFVRKEETTTDGEEEEITSSSTRELLFFLFCVLLL